MSSRRGGRKTLSERTSTKTTTLSNYVGAGLAVVFVLAVGAFEFWEGMRHPLKSSGRGSGPSCTQTASGYSCSDGTQILLKPMATPTHAPAPK